MRVSSFKAQYRQAPPRAGTPPRPVYEPISPILLPIDSTAALPASAKDIPPIHSSNGIHTAIQTAPIVDGAVRPTPLFLGSPQATTEAPLRSAPLPPLKAHLSPALGPPIDALANAAPPSLEASPVILDSSRRPSHGPISPTTAFPRLHASARAAKHVYTDSSFLYDERPSKRARSEFVASPHHNHQYPRPATSHVSSSWSYNVEQMVDNGVRMYQGNQAPEFFQHDSASKRLSDAQLLLDFAVSAPHSVQPPDSTAKRRSISHLDSDQHVVPTVVDTSDPHLATPYQHIREPKPASPPAVDHETRPAELVPHASPVQTHTPPEDTTNAAAVDPPLTAVNTITEEEKKPKKHQGWPKGKPRGPRSGSAAKEKKKATPKTANMLSTATAESLASDQLHSPQSLPADGPDVAPVDASISDETSTQTLGAPALQTRRLSCSNMAPPETQSSHISSTFQRAQSVPMNNNMVITPPSDEASQTAGDQLPQLSQATICAGCNSTDSVISIGDGEQWISCDGCKGWFHYACAGFKSQREVRAIDKFYCNGCKPKFGDTTKVRKSNRAHTAVDYAGLNEGIMKTSDDNPEHHYIQAFKNGDFDFTPETFARLPPECVTADFIEKMNGFYEPMVIPAALNPRPRHPKTDLSVPQSSDDVTMKEPCDEQQGYELVPDDGQDLIDMVIPEGLTVRRVAELYGPTEVVPVIDVKAQEGEDKKWTMTKWADYYEQQGEKPVRNVISLEVSRSKLGKLIRRPKVVRDMDLQDSVWPEDDKVLAPPVQFYCLMSVADCYTDFHIDFGGSSVYYHIVKGRKTFFFIPPTKQNLKKYEDWCLSPGQSHEWLGNQVKDCYRVDLYPGDTALIPSGWIHAVWTPEDSLVIGGNYLTRIHYGMQIKVLEIEKNTKVAPKFRYPFFQKIMWLSMIRYLEEDPLPPAVEELLLDGGHFERAVPIYCEPDKFGHNSDLGPENYNSRYYPKGEIEGLVDLQNYIWRTVMVSQGRIEGITQTTRNAVTRSIPKGHGEPMVLARRFAMWAAWKKGNEKIPQWAHPDAVLADATDLKGAKKMERESWNETLKLVRGGERHSSLRARVSEPTQNGETRVQAGPPVTGFLRPHKEHVTTPKTSQLGPKRIACDACRKRRIRCKHKDELVESPQSSTSGGGFMNIPQSSSPPATAIGDRAVRRYSDADIPHGGLPFTPMPEVSEHNMNGGPVSADLNADSLANKSGRVKACADCRKSKRRCIHDENGNVDPVKAAEAPVPRGSASKKRRISEVDDGEALTKKIKMESFAGLVNGEVSHWNRYPLQKPRPSSLSGSQEPETMPVDPELLMMDHNEAAHAMTTEPHLSNGHLSNGDGDAHTIVFATPANPFSRETIVSSIEDTTCDPMDDVMQTSQMQMEILPPQQEQHQQQQFPPEPRTPGPPSNMFYDSTNGGADIAVSVSPSRSSSARSMRHGHIRPASMTPNWNQSSKDSARSWNGKSTTPKITPGGKKSHRDSNFGIGIKTEPRSEQKARAVDSKISGEMTMDDMNEMALGMGMDGVHVNGGSANEDVASLALALQLQMEEHGLRTRGK